MKKVSLLSFLLILVCTSLLSQSETYYLDSNWKAKRAADVLTDGTALTDSEFRPEGWMNAVVPGTVLTTLLKNKLIPDPFFGMNNTLIPDIHVSGRDHYTYWFYTEFNAPGQSEGKEAWLCFRGINYSAEIFLNGHRVNTSPHKGMFMREKYLVTQYLNRGKPNKLAVLVEPPDPEGDATSGQGGDGLIGKSVTMQFTAGWDWICPIPDRNTGIWDKVYLELTGAADLRNPFVKTRVPGIRVPGQKQAAAFINPSTEVKNATSQTVSGMLKIELEGISQTVKVSLAPFETKTISFKEMKVDDPKLWWPNGMGDQPLYNLKIELSDNSGKIIDSELVTFGIRETGNYFDETIKARVFTVNGQKVFIKGGNWIASDALLRLSEERYDAEIRMHAGLNMNMIRVWGGGLTERPEFYNACDKYGILVWQDIWITGDCNGEWRDPVKKDSQARRKAYPDDHRLFIESLTDQVKMLRNHPSLYLWCGGNETYPPADILSACKEEIFPVYDPGRFFLDKSTAPGLMTNTKGGVGDGPYGIREPREIFTDRSFPFNPETGSIGIPNYDGLVKIIPENELFPPRTQRVSGSWLYHKYLPLMDFPDRYGKVKDARDFCFKAQLVSYEQYRALQEAFNHRMWDWYTGMLVWKNQNPWTALRGFFYDYYLDYTGGYFGYRHGAEPVHIQLNLNDSAVCVLNQTAQAMNGMTATIAIFNMHGKKISENNVPVSLKANELKLLDKVSLKGNDDDVFFLRLMLSGSDGTIDENLYWLTPKSRSYEKLNELSKTKIDAVISESGENKALIKITNKGDETAFFIRLKVTDGKDQLVLPSWFSENYFTLFPGEKREINLDLPSREGKLKLVMEGWNVEQAEVKM